MWRSDEKTKRKVKILNNIKVSPDSFGNQEYERIVKHALGNFLCSEKKVGIFFQKHYDVFYQELIEIPFSSALKAFALLSVTLSISAQNLSL